MSSAPRTPRPESLSTADADLAGPDLDDGTIPTAPQRRSRLRAFLGLMGPGLVTGVADDDPSGVATYSQAGAQMGMGLLWTAPATLPLMYVVQEICDRTALATGDSLGTLTRRKFGRRARWVIGVLVVALIVANCLNVAADLAAVGSGMQMVGAGPDQMWAGIAGVGLTVALVFGSFERIAAVFKWLCLVLLVYVAVLVVAHVNWREVALGSVGLRMHWTWTSISLLVAVLGTTISPYMFFWQSAHRIEEMRSDTSEPGAALPLRRRGKVQAKRRLVLARFDVFFGMLVSVLAMFAIIAASASTIGRNGPVQIDTAAQAAQALQPVAGHWASVIFAIGFIATGVLAVPVLASSGSIALAGLLNRQWGFDHSVRRAPAFYALIGVGTLGGIVIAWLSDSPVHLLVLSAVINGIAAAPFLVVVMLISQDRGLMGDYTNGRLTTIAGWLTTLIMAIAGVAGIYVTLWPPA